MRRFNKWIVTLCIAVCAFVLMAAPIYADTDGTEIQVAQPAQLEIQLGTAWSGVGFQLRTDAGIYPDEIIVGEDGILRLEIGGSSTYTLTCLNSAMAAPQVDETVTTDATDTESTFAPSQTDTEKAEASGEDTEVQNDEGKKEFAGIPTIHIVLFGGGLLLAVGGLIAIHVVNKRREERAEYDDYYEDDE